jgi:adenylylsulfate kinase-like enzyme
MRGREQDMDNGTRDELLFRLAEAVRSVTIAHPTRVAIDGIPAAGKTTLADELAVVLRAQAAKSSAPQSNTCRRLCQVHLDDPPRHPVAR